jgi:hypothetical protein
MIARGGDAAAVPISTSFGPNTLHRFTVWTERVAPENGLTRRPYKGGSARGPALSHVIELA